MIKKMMMLAMKMMRMTKMALTATIKKTMMITYHHLAQGWIGVKEESVLKVEGGILAIVHLVKPEEKLLIQLSSHLCYLHDMFGGLQPDQTREEADHEEDTGHAVHLGGGRAVVRRVGED